MGNSEEGKPSKPEKSSSPATDQNSIHGYPDWAMMQAYYGPRFAVPPYLNSAVASPHTPPPYMWVLPQSTIPHYGAPYAAFYAHGGVYRHPGVSIAGTAFSTDTPVKSSGNTDGGFMKKSKEFDGLAISTGNGNADSGECGTDHRLPESEETDDSSDGSNGVTAEAGQRGMKRSRPGSPNSGGDSKAQKSSSPIPSAEEGQGSEKMIETNRPANTPRKPRENMDNGLELKDLPSNVLPRSSIPNEAWLQNERELKRERRKQSNRESAKRSRLRKQAEAEELGTKVQTLATENMTLKSKIHKFMETSKKLKLENATLMEKLKGAQAEAVNFHKIDDLRLEPVGTANLLARVNNNDSTNGRNEDIDSCQNRNPVAKLHQLLDAIASPRADAVAAS